ncbi:MAG: FAD-dependent oxidoreductase [Bacteroidota bacterium]
MNNRSDILIIGGGAIGLCVAHYLSLGGAAVTVVDQGEMGHGSSLHNAGYVCPSHFVPLAAPGQFGQAVRWMFNPRSPLYVKPRLNRDLIAWASKFWKSSNERTMRRAMPLLSELLLEGSRLFEELSHAEGMDFHLTKQGLCMLFATGRGRIACQHEAELAHEVGIEARMVNHDDLGRMDPSVEFRAGGGVFFPGDAHLVPATLMSDLAASLERRGVTLIRNCAVKGFNRSGDAITSVVTSVGDLKSDDVVLAGGAWSPAIGRLLGLRILMQPGKGYSVTVPDPPVKPIHPYIFMERRVAVTPFQDSLRFAGTMEIAGLDTSINRPRVAAILDSIPLYFANIPRPSSVGLDPWAGLRPVSPDGLPYIGRFHQIRNLIAATGHAMLGISLSTVTGKLVAEIVRGGQASLDLALLSPNRFD